MLPSLKKHHDEHLLRQLKLRWDNHKARGSGGVLGTGSSGLVGMAQGGVRGGVLG